MKDQKHQNRKAVIAALKGTEMDGVQKKNPSKLKQMPRPKFKLDSNC